MIQSRIAGAIAGLVLAGFVLARLGTSAGAQAPTVKFMLDFAMQGQQSPFVLAAEGGHFARAGVSVQVDRGYGSADAIVKVASGAYDMAFADIGAIPLDRPSRPTLERRLRPVPDIRPDVGIETAAP